jgi:hypothetical protein
MIDVDVVVTVDPCESVVVITVTPVEGGGTGKVVAVVMSDPCESVVVSLITVLDPGIEL